MIEIRPFRSDETTRSSGWDACDLIRPWNIHGRTSRNADVIAFYGALGYRADDVVSLGKRLIDD